MNTGNEAETVEFKTIVKIADADGVPIREGSVIQDTKDKDGQRGVVIRIVREGQGNYPIFSAIGDMMISMGPGVTTGSNRYKDWRHVPEADQTYKERLLSWKHRDYDHDDSRPASEDEGLAIDGIMALLPPDIVCWEDGPWPDRLEDALEFLVEHLEELKNPKKEKHGRD